MAKPHLSKPAEVASNSHHAFVNNNVVEVADEGDPVVLALLAETDAPSAGGCKIDCGDAPVPVERCLIPLRIRIKSDWREMVCELLSGMVKALPVLVGKDERFNVSFPPPTTAALTV